MWKYFNKKNNVKHKYTCEYKSLGIWFVKAWMSRKVLDLVSTKCPQIWLSTNSHRILLLYICSENVLKNTSG